MGGVHPDSFFLLSKVDQVEKLHAGQRRRRVFILVALALGLGLAVLWAIQTGPVAIPTGMVLRISLHRLLHRLLPHRLWAGIPVTWPHTHEIIVIDVRWPRVLLGVLVGAALATSGCTMQGLFRNPMASPYTLGLASGAAFGAALAIVLESLRRADGLRRLPHRQRAGRSLDGKPAAGRAGYRLLLLSPGLFHALHRRREVGRDRLLADGRALGQRLGQSDYRPAPHPGSWAMSRPRPWG